MSADDRTGALVSVVAHALLVLLLVFVAAAPSEALEQDTVELVELDFDSALADAPMPVEQGEPARAEAGDPSAPAQSLDEPRPAPPAATPVRIPEAQRPTPTRPDPLPRPRQNPDARPTRPSPPSTATRPEPAPTPPRQPDPTEGRGNTTGSASTDGSGTGPGDGSGGDAPAEVGFQFGNRDFTCGQPAFPGVEGTIQYALTFAPDGRYISGRPRSRNATFQNAVEAVLRTCRAAPLPPQAAQVPQTTTATFRFVTGG